MNPATRRYLEAFALLIVWMAAGWSFDLGPNEYLLAGVPLIVVFQLFVRRKPLRDLWVRDSAAFSVGLYGWVIALALAVKPVFELYRTLARELWVPSAWMVCAAAGALPAAFAIRHQSGTKLVRALPSFVVAIVLGLAVMAASSLAHGGYLLFPSGQVSYFLGQFLLYFVVGFVLEEVAFRGAIDSHLYHADGPDRAPAAAWLSAVVVSVLWGIWHLPLLGTHDFGRLIASAPTLIFAHVVIGVPLSFCWRTGGTLLLPAIAHAIIEAYRNVVLF